MKNAFTLAEVLITLGIIGVVAAMTMPTLIQNHQKRSLEVATQKFYSMMSQAVKQYMADEGVDDLRNTPLTSMSDDDASFDNAQKAVNQFIQKYFKIAKVCEVNQPCFAKKYLTQDKEVEIDPDFFNSNYFYGICYNSFVTSDGMVFFIYAADYHWPFSVFADINGRKGPNKVGYDLWTMSIFHDGSIDEGGVDPECRSGSEECDWGYGITSIPSEAREGRFEQMCLSGQYGGCFGHFFNNGFKFDY